MTEYANYDSIVIAGAGLAALTFAARLARNPKFADKVSIVGPPTPETRRLLAGVSMRGTAADAFCEALDCSLDELLEAIYGNRNANHFATEQVASMAKKDKQTGEWVFSKEDTWQKENQPIMYGMRNSRLQGALRSLIQHLPIHHHSEKVRDADHLKSFAQGKIPLLVNVTNNPGLLGNPVRSIRNFAVAAQVPFRAKSTGLQAPFRDKITYAPLINRDGVVDVGYYTPFADPLSPSATYYGIMARIIPAKRPFDKEKEIAILTEELLAVGDKCGLEPVDPAETLGTAAIPSGLYRSPAPSKAGTLELKQLYCAGPPAYYADGILSCAIGGLTAAEAILAGKDPRQAVRKAIKPYRWYNKLWWLETTQLPWLVDALMHISVKGAMFYPHTSSVNKWFGKRHPKQVSVAVAS